MAPSPENDNTPKAPDKGDKLKNENKATEEQLCESGTGNKESDTKEASVVGLDDTELKALLDEAIAYKSPKDRIGKSELFRNLLTKAEDDIRTARATSASGSELVRYHNTTATRRHRHKRQPSSISENLSHGGSLNNLAKEDLYESTNHLQKPKKTVSARQREGGSLPCNVNVPVSYDRQFFEEARRRKEKQKAEYTVIDMESESLLKHDELNQTFTVEGDIERPIARNQKVPVKYTSRATLEIGNVDDGVTLPSLERADKNVSEPDYRDLRELKAKYSLLATLPGQQWYGFDSRTAEEKKVDENGNALNQNNSETKKNKKEKRDKNVVLIKSENVVGHRSDIINDLDKLVEFIGGNEDGTNKPKSNVHKSKLHKHVSTEEKTTNKKQRTRSKAKNDNMQKSTSMEEISITKLEDFNFSMQENDSKVSLRPTKSNAERPRERRSWGNSEPLHFQTLQLYGNASAENLESADFRVVTKKKKSKKRRNSVSGRRQQYSSDPHNSEFNPRQSPELRRKSACSVPHSEKSNDSSDVDSVHSLPIDTNCISRNTDSLNSEINLPISYADIAKNCNSLERPKWNRPPSERKSERLIEKQLKDNKNEKTPLKNFINEISTLVDNVENPPKVLTTTTTVVNPVVVTTTTPPSIVQPIINNPTTISVTSPITPLPVVNTVAIPFSEKQGTIAQVVKNNNNNSPPDVSYSQNWPCIQNHKTTTENKGKTQVTTFHKPIRNGNNNNNFKNIKNAQISTNKSQNIKTNLLQNTVAVINTNNNIQVIQNEDVIHQQQSIYIYPQNMPTNIPDVSTIEKMHFQQLQHNKNNNPQPSIINHVIEITSQGHNHDVHQLINATCVSENNTILNNICNNTLKEEPNDVKLCDEMNEPSINATSNNSNQCPVNLINDKKLTNNCTNDKSILNVCDNDRTRPAVVILSGDSSKDITGITFGFDINEQLLCGDVCSDFISRYIIPESIHSKSYNHQIVNFVGNAWEDIINEINGNVRYYEEV